MDIFETIGSARGAALTKINLGRSLRRKGRAASKSENCGPEGPLIEETFKEAQGYLMSACEHFTKSQEQDIDHPDMQKDSLEVFYAVEAYDELGCLHRDWVASLFDCGQHNLGQLTSHLGKAATALMHAAISNWHKGPIDRKTLARVSLR